MQSFQNLPEELRVLKNWVLWKFEKEEGKKKPTKVPYQINGFKADVTNPKAFASFDECFNTLSFGSYDGLGFSFTNSEYSGIDLDDARILPKTGEENPNYQIDVDRQIRIYQEFDSYSERSPSGNGCHIIIKGKIPGIGKKKSFVELYSSGHYFTMTGDVCNNKPIIERQELLTMLWQQMGGQVGPYLETIDEAETNTDEEILELAIKHNGDKFIQLADGNVSAYPTPSEADQAYMNIIAYYTNNRKQVERIFRNSKLMRPKANKNRIYLPNTIDNAFDQKIPFINIEGLKDQFAKKLNGHGSVAQLVEPAVHNSSVASSNLAAPTISLPPGLLGKLAQFIYNAAPRPIPEIALAGAIGLMAGITGRAYNVLGTGLNQYILLLAKTGRGKESMASGIDKLMNAVKMQVPTSTSFRGPGIINSGQALVKHLNNTSNCFVSVLGEFGITIDRISEPHASSADKMLYQCLLDLYNKSGFGQTFQPSIYSDKANNTSVTENPALTILGESTPKIFYGCLNEDMIAAGLLPRFLIVEYDGDRVDLNKNHYLIKPEWDLLEEFGGLIAHCETIMRGNHVVNVQATDEAWYLLENFDKSSTRNINTSDDVIGELWNRAHMKAMRLSALIAVGINKIDPIILPEYVKWSIDLVQNDIKLFSSKFEKGEIGKDSHEVKQMADMIRVIIEYRDKDFEYVKKYDAVEMLHKDNVITHGFLNSRLRQMSSFRKDKQGPTPAIKRTVLNLIDAGKLIDITSVQMLKDYKTAVKSYAIGKNISN